MSRLSLEHEKKQVELVEEDLSALGLVLTNTINLDQISMRKRQQFRASESRATLLHNLVEMKGQEK